MGALHEIDSERRRQLALDNRDTQLREAMAMANIGCWEWNVIDQTVTWSPELRRILGVAEDFPASVQGFLDLVHPEDRAWAIRTTQLILKCGAAIDTPFRIIRPDGTIRIVKGRGAASRFEDGRPTFLVGVIQDIGNGFLIRDFTHAMAALDSISARERQVLSLVVQGGTSKTIARILRLSPKTVDTYRSRIMAKLGVEDLAGLIRFSIRHGLVMS